MMTVPMDKATASPSPRELAQRLLKKNAEHESRLRRSTQSKVPSDPNIWLQMRENYEKIVLTDHDFSEKHEIEYLLWQLHYKRIEEFRGHIVAAGKNNANLDRAKRIRSSFRGFLSEATGFYHDLMLKIRSTYGLPLGYFSEGPDCSPVPDKDEKKMVGVKKGLLSCYRCLIYLGDLTRYKGLYGDADYANREYAAASIYYKEAASLCPSNGNPHHQLAILASYAGDEVTAIYRYFRSLAVDSPFSAARENLILAFDKNHEIYTQLSGNNKTPAGRSLPSRSVGRARGRGETRFQPKGHSTEQTSKEREYSIPEILKAFYVRFVRLNGILFTRTSLETFGELSATVISDLQILLSSGPHEELNFGVEAAENALSVVKLVAILIFTVHNANKDTDNQSYAEIVQRRVLLQNAFTTAFEFVGYLLRRCVELHDIASSIYLPAILVFIEWLACHPDFVACSEMDEKQADARSFFWNQCVSFMNKLILTGLARVDGDDDETCFFDMGTYEEGETGNRLALWEDVELRGFSPLVPAQVILDFSNKHVFGSEGSAKEKKSRVERILAAGKALLNFVQIDQLRIYFDASSKKFLIAAEPPCSESSIPPVGSSNVHMTNRTEQEPEVSSKIGSVGENLDVLESKAQFYPDGDDDEEIVFKPPVSEKLLRVPLEQTSNEFKQPGLMPDGNWSNNGAPPPMTFHSNGPVPTPNIYVQSFPISSIGWAANAGQQAIPGVGPRSTSEFLESLKASDRTWVSTGAPLAGTQDTVSMPSFSNIISDQRTSASSLGCFSNLDNTPMLPGQDPFVLSALKNVNIGASGFLDQRVNGGFSGLQSLGSVPQVSVEATLNSTNSIIGQFPTEVTIPSAFRSVMPSVASSDGISMKSMETQTGVSKKNPVSRPGRHVGPPPGFNNAPSKRQDDSNLVGTGQHVQANDGTWLDGYRPSSEHVNNQRFGHSNVTTASSAFTTPFPFPGKQAFNMHPRGNGEKQWQDFHLFGPTKQLPELNFQQGNQQNGPLAEPFPAQSVWSGNYLV
ncbi:protein SMG7 isoform X2 [Oryza brachyantha]|uniref:protein SMG7 isoform X2 n=1 Tax=Oryza brachyantha TaxID=4533 RepID=UPI0003EAE03C|nr:protein SMG7 isoform X2 [Oryza brachyantha]